MMHSLMLLLCLVPVSAKYQSLNSLGTLNPSSLPEVAKASTRPLRFVELSGGGANAVLSNEGVGMVPSTFNLIKNILGAGVLSLPAGVAAFSDDKAAVVPAVSLVVTLGVLSCYCFALIGRLCEMTGTKTYKEAVTKALGPMSGRTLAAATTLKTFAACLMYSIIIGDTAFSLAKTAGLAKMIPFLSARWQVLVAATASMLVPLCLMRSLAVLSYTSLLGIAGTLFTAGFMGLRLVDGSYKVGGRFHQALVNAAAATKSSPSLPTFGSTTKLPKAFILISMLSTAYIAHYNAPRFYQGLKDRSVARFSALSAMAFGVSIVVFASMMAFGFLTFGSATKGLVLNNYAASDPLATISRVCILASIVFGYPLTFVGLRDGVIEMGGSSSPSLPVKDAVSVVLLAGITVAAIFVRNLGLVASVGGALLGSSIIYIFPACSFIAAVRQQVAAGKVVLDQNKGLKAEYVLNHGTAVVGVLLAVIGMVVSLRKG